MSNISIEVVEKATYLLVRVSGTRDYSEAINSVGRIFKSGSSNYSKFLILDESPSCFSVSEVFKIMLEILKQEDRQKSEQFKISYCNALVEAGEMMRFAETVSENRGLVFKGFAVESEAIEWLTNSDKDLSA